MVLFGKLFEKKVCGICGEEIKLFGNRNQIIRIFQTEKKIH